MFKLSNIKYHFSSVIKSSTKFFIYLAILISLVTSFIVVNNKKYFEEVIIVETDIFNPKVSTDFFKVLNNMIEDNQNSLISEKMNISIEDADNLKGVFVNKYKTDNQLSIEAPNKNFFYITIQFWEGGKCNVYGEGLKNYFVESEFTKQKKIKTENLYNEYNSIIDLELNKLDSTTNTINLNTQQSIDGIVNKHSLSSELKSRKSLNQFSAIDSSVFDIFDSYCSKENQGFSSMFIIINAFVLYVLLCFLFITFKIVLKMDNEE
jgi:hypothetical protein